MPPVTAADALRLLMTTPSPAPTPAAALSSGSTALLSAVIAGCVALVTVLITHYFTRNRAREEWTRERIYEATSGLVDTYREFMRAVNDWTPKQHITVGGSGKGGMSLQVSGQDRRDALDEAYHSYITYLNKLDLLLLDVDARQLVGTVMRDTRELWDDIRRADENEGDKQHTTGRKPFRLQQAHLARTHQDLIKWVKRSYFVSPRRYEQVERAARQQEARTQSTTQSQRATHTTGTTGDAKE